ncbi:MAG: GNAT family N-acetyltransferase [Desulfobacteraceae bacterium]|nr:MAG: GNAT family N-acetyltransferase [Desulfobacteraceae bacterium]
MKIDILTTLEQIDNIKKDWDSIYEKDANASFFLSWQWVRGWCEVTRFHWIVLTARKNISSPPVAFLPLGFRTRKINRFVSVTDFVSCGGNWSDHSGFLCTPEDSESAISAFALFFKSIHWDSLSLNEIADPRTVYFLNSFKTRNFQIIDLKPTECPYMELPETWSRYCEEIIPKKVYKDISYNNRRIQRETGFRETSANSDNLTDSVEVFINLYRKRRKPTSPLMVDRFREIFPRCFKEDSLRLNIIWDHDKPMAAYSGFLDKKNGTFLLYSTAFDEDYRKYSPGSVIISESVKFAIENGFKVYDFGRGTEEYKYTLGAKDRLNSNMVIIRNNAVTTIKRLILKLQFRLKGQNQNQKDIVILNNFAAYSPDLSKNKETEALNQHETT